VLGQHSGLHLINEPEIIYGLRRAGHDVHDHFPPAGREELLARLCEVGLCRRHLEGLPESVRKDFVSAPENFTFRDVYERLLPKPEGDRLIWGEKSLNNFYFLEDIETLYPDAVFLHIVRDARAAVFSKIRKKRQTARHHCHWLQDVRFAARQAVLWARFMAIARAAAQRLPRGRWIELRYENLIKQSRQNLERLCMDLGIQFEPGMLEAELRKSDPVLLSPETAGDHERLGKDFDPSRIRSFDDMPAPLVWVVERYSGTEMERLGYSLVKPGLAPWQRILLGAVLPTRKDLERFIVHHGRKRKPQ